MAGDDDKKKKKKKDKKEKEEKKEPEPEPEPEPAPAPPAGDDEGGDWFSGGDDAPAEGGGEGGDEGGGDGEPAGGEEDGGFDFSNIDEGGDFLAEGEEPPPPPKKKPKFFVHWDRKKARFYDYNFDYGENYYTPVVKYMDTRSRSGHTDMPRRMAFAERGMRSSLERHSRTDFRTESLLNDVRSSIKSLEASQKNYMWEHVKGTY